MRHRASWFVVPGLVALLLTVLVPLLGPAGEAATPSSGAVSPDSPGPITWQGPVYTASVATDTATGRAPCDSLVPSGATCDHFRLTVTVPAGYWDTHAGGADVTVTWTVPGMDYDLYVYDASGVEVARSAGSANNVEHTVVPNASGTYDVVVVPWAVVASGYTGSIQFVQQPKTASAAAVFDPAASVAFGPASIVSAHFLGAEPEITMERPVAGSYPGAVDPNRIFIDWPLSSRTNIGQLSRSTDGGQTFRLLIDPACPQRSRPNCASGGGGDTENEVNLVTGTVFFADQEAVAQEALVSSNDHGDSFPLAQQHALTNLAAGVDRQWLTWMAPGAINVASGAGTPVTREIHGLLAYHVPAAGEYIQAIDRDGLALPQPVPQILSVSQSGPIRADNTGGPGAGWIYQSYRDGNGFEVATAFGPDFQNPQAWQVNHVTDDDPAIFPWISLDSHGNAYAVWVTGGVVYYSASNVEDPANNPAAGGRPGSTWSAKQRVSLPAVGSAVFPEVVAGDAGRIAVVYDGTTAYKGVSDGAPLTAPWNTYAAVITNALARGGTAPVISTGVVSHRPVHYGSICTSGTTCTGDRTLLDMIDVGMDQDGRVGVVFTDNNNAIGMPDGADQSTRNGPFVHFAKQVAGPALLGSASTVTPPFTPAKLRPNGASVADPSGDATWPNTAEGRRLPALDLTAVQVTVQGKDLVARLSVADASVVGMVRDLQDFNAALPLQTPAKRLQYVLRFSTATDVYHLSLESLADGRRRAFAGRLDANDVLTNGSSALGAGYHTDPAIPVGSDVDGDTLTLRVRLADLGLGESVDLASVTAFAMAGPLEEEESLILDTMRTVDVTAPVDLKVTTRTPAPAPQPTPTPAPLSKPVTDTLGTVTGPVNGTPLGPTVKPVETAVATDVSGAGTSAGATAGKVTNEGTEFPEEVTERGVSAAAGTADKASPGAGDLVDPDGVLKK